LINKGRFLLVQNSLKRIGRGGRKIWEIVEIHFFLLKENRGMPESESANIAGAKRGRGGKE